MNTKQVPLQQEPEKRPYASPMLQVYGTLAQLVTTVSSMAAHGDGSTMATHNTHK